MKSYLLKLDVFTGLESESERFVIVQTEENEDVDAICEVIAYEWFGEYTNEDFKDFAAISQITEIESQSILTFLVKSGVGIHRQPGLY